MTIKYLLFLLFFLTIPFHGQSAVPDDSIIPADQDLVKKIEKLNAFAFETRTSNPGSSLNYSGLSLSLSIKAGYKTGEINALLLMGMVYKNIGAYEKAMASYFNAMRVADETGDKQRVSSCLNNIGSVFQLQGNYSKALHYYQLSMNIEEDYGNKEQLSIRLYNIGTVYETIDSLDMAYAYYLNSLLIEEKSGNKEGIYFALYGIAGIETKKGQYESALTNISRALKVAHELNDPLGISVCHCEMGKLFMAQQKYPQAVSAFDSSVFYAQSGDLLNELKDGYFNLSKAYKKIGENNKAYENLERYVVINDSLNSLGIKSRVAELETRFQVDRKEKEIAYLRETGALKSENADYERRNRNFLLITVILAMLLAVYNLKKIAVDIRKAILLTVGILVFLILVALIFLYSGVTSHEPDIKGFFSIFADVLTYSVLPIFILILATEHILLKRYLKKAGELTEQIKTLHIPDTGQQINLQFDGKEGSMSISITDLICFEANDNYSAIYYLKSGEVKKELRRITLKRIEDQLTDHHEIIRCHKSFIINLLNVSHVSGNAQGYKFHLQKLDFAIPVSRNFPQSMINKIKEGQ